MEIQLSDSNILKLSFAKDHSEQMRNIEKLHKNHSDVALNQIIDGLKRTLSTQNDFNQNLQRQLVDEKEKVISANSTEQSYKLKLDDMTQVHARQRSKNLSN